MRDEDWEALDEDGDGGVQLDVYVTREELRRGLAPPPKEWPSNRDFESGLPPGVSLERVLAAFDQDRDGELSGREMRPRRDLMRELDRNQDGRVLTEEIEFAIARAVDAGVEAGPDAFERRWDLDGNGKLGDDELPEGFEVLWRDLLARKR